MDVARPAPVRLLGITVLVAAALLRLAAWHSAQQTAWADSPTVDAFTYFEQARALFEGREAFSGGFYQPPGLPWLMALEFRLVGEVSPAIPRAFNLVFGWLTTALLLRLGRQLGQELLGKPWLGVLAATLYTFYPSTLLFELDLLTPATTNLCLVAALALLVDTRPWRGGLAGLLLGFAVVVHPSYLLALVGLLPFAWRSRPTLLALGTGAALALAPTTLHNLREGHLSLVSQNAGLNLYLGNNPDWKHSSTLRPGVAFRELVLEADPEERDQYERNAWWLRRTGEELAADPWSLPWTLATKALWSVNNREIPRNEDYRCRTRAGPVAWIRLLPLRYGLALPFALAGAVLAWRRRRRGLVTGWVGLHATLILFLVADRYRLATWPLVCLLAALGLPGVIALVGGLTRGRLPSSVWLLLPAAATLPWLPIDHLTAYHEGWCLHLDGNEAVEAGRWEEASALYLDAARLEPDEPGHWYWLGEARVQTGDYAGAIDAYEHVVRIFPEHYQSRLALAREEGRHGNFSAAADHQAVACATPGPRENTCARYVELLWKAHRTDEARAFLEQRPELRAHEKVRGLPGLDP